MRSGGLFHPNFFYHPRRSLETSYLTAIRIFKIAPEGADWIPGEGMDITPDTLVWQGYARVQPNKDWRARPREVQFEYDAVQAIRVQIPIGKNLLGATYDPVTERVTSYGKDPEFIKDMRITIDSNNVKGFDEVMKGQHLYIRNAIQNQNLWAYNFLTDTKTGGNKGN